MLAFTDRAVHGEGEGAYGRVCDGRELVLVLVRERDGGHDVVRERLGQVRIILVVVDVQAQDPLLKHIAGTRV